MCFYNQDIVSGWKRVTVLPLSKQSLIKQTSTKSGERLDLSPGEIHADAFAQDKLHLGWVAELHHHAYGQVDPLVWSSTSTQLRTLVNRGVPGGLRFHLQQNSTGQSWLWGDRAERVTQNFLNLFNRACCISDLV